MSNSKNKLTTYSETASVPLKWVGPVKYVVDKQSYEREVPLATYESPLWPSVARGAKVSTLTEGIKIIRSESLMTRSVCIEAKSALDLLAVKSDLKNSFEEYAAVVAADSKYAKLIDLKSQSTGNLLFIRIEINSADASGHNMATKIAEKILETICEKFTAVSYVSLSGNFCTDKKVSSVNPVLGRGRSRTAEIIVPRKICKKLLRATPEQIHDLNYKKNFVGSCLAGSLHSANAHYANMLLAIYLATGQDAANIVEGSQGITYTNVIDEELYFSVNLPNLIVGTVGNGKELEFVSDNLKQLGIDNTDPPGESAENLADIVAATVLCGEISLLAALANPGELVKSHLALER